MTAMELAELMDEVVQALEMAPRHGAETDEPQGARYVRVSDTLAREIAAVLRVRAQG